MRMLFLTAVLLAAFAACNSPQNNPDRIRENTAKATSAVKADTKAVAEGIKEGLSKGSTVNINSASREDLMKLPGITEARADRIIAARPYANSNELITKKVLTQGEYNQISGKVTAK
jgi:DNA uptake protein ComE-like DNA-binding protein